MRPKATHRTAFRALFAIAIVFGSACTLIESKDGLVGPPIDEPDGFVGNDAHPKDVSVDGDASTLDASPIGDDSSDAQTIIDSATDGSTPVAITLYTDQVDPTGIFADGTSIYWAATSNTRGLFKGSRDGGLPTTITRLDDVNQSLGDAFDLVVDGTYVYWTDRKGFVYRRPLTGGAYELCFNVPLPAFLAIGFGVLYTTNYDLDGGGSIFRGTCGQPATTMFGFQPRASGIAVGTSPPDLYWGRNSSDQIAFGPPRRERVQPLSLRARRRRRNRDRRRGDVVDRREPANHALRFQDGARGPAVRRERRFRRRRHRGR